MPKYLPLKNVLFVLLAMLLVSTFACSSENTVVSTPTPTSTTSPEPTSLPDLQDIRQLDNESIGSGKIDLNTRLSAITDLISAYSAVLGEISQKELKDVEQRINDLEIERQLVQALLDTLNYIQYESEDEEPRADYKFFQAQLKGAYIEADFFHPQPIDIVPCFQRILDCSLPPQPELVKEPEDHYDTDAWITVALHLAPDEIPDWFQQDVLERENLEGYKLTHQFFALLLQRRCWPDYRFGLEYNKKLDELAIRIAEEEESDVRPAYIDLYAERAAMLIASEYGSLVKREWIEQILENRLPNGLWPTTLGDEQHNMHSTYNSLWAIGGYQVLLQRGEQGRKELFPFLSED